MERQNKTNITVGVTINATVEKAWQYWTKPEHIMQWNNASDDWHTPRAENDLRVGGSFLYRMEAKDGSFGFDFDGVYDAVTTGKYIEYTLGDERKVKINFTAEGDKTNINETFEAETQNSIEMQRGGWQAILNNFKRHVEKS